QTVRPQDGDRGFVTERVPVHEVGSSCAVRRKGVQGRTLSRGLTRGDGPPSPFRLTQARKGPVGHLVPSSDWKAFSRRGLCCPKALSTDPPAKGKPGYARRSCVLTPCRGEHSVVPETGCRSGDRKNETRTQIAPATSNPHRSANKFHRGGPLPLNPL